MVINNYNAHLTTHTQDRFHYAVIPLMRNLNDISEVTSDLGC